MVKFYWIIRLLSDVVALGWTNRSPAVSLGLIGFLLLGALFTAAQASAPFIYTLF